MRPVTAAVADSFGTLKDRITSSVPWECASGSPSTRAAACAASRRTNVSVHTAANPSLVIDRLRSCDAAVDLLHGVGEADVGLAEL